MSYQKQMTEIFGELSKYIGLDCFQLDIMHALYEDAIFVRFTKKLERMDVIKSPMDIKAFFGPVVDSVRNSELVKDIESVYQDKIKVLTEENEKLEKYKIFYEMHQGIMKGKL